MADGDRIWPDRWHVRAVESTGSTNADLLAAAGHGAPDRSVLVAGFQTAGRGRLGRTWEAPAGANLLVSLLILTERPYAAVQRVALAAAGAAEQVGGITVGLKWPNDLLVGTAKLAGVLAQAAPGGVVVGVGMNIRWAPPGAALLGLGIDPSEVLAVLLERHDALPVDVTADYRRRLTTLGAEVEVQLADRVVRGTAIDLDPDGSLVVGDLHGEIHRFTSGDVVHLRRRP